MFNVYVLTVQHNGIFEFTKGKFNKFSLRLNFSYGGKCYIEPDIKFDNFWPILIYCSTFAAELLFFSFFICFRFAGHSYISLVSEPMDRHAGHRPQDSSDAAQATRT